jgi:hypothetical protein
VGQWRIDHGLPGWIHGGRSRASNSRSDQLLLARKEFELQLLSLTRAEYPNVLASARELVDAQFTYPQELLKGIVDFMVSGVARCWKSGGGAYRTDTHEH